PLVLNTQTGLVSPQFHVIYDDAFDTVKRDAKFSSLWAQKAKLQLYQADYDLRRDRMATIQSLKDQPTDDVYDLTSTPTIPSMFETPWETSVEKSAVTTGDDLPDPQVPLDDDVRAQAPPTQTHSDANASEPTNLNSGSQPTNIEPSDASQTNSPPNSEVNPSEILRRSSRKRVPTDRFRAFMNGRRFAGLACYLSTFCPTFTEAAKVELLQESPAQLATDNINPIAMAMEYVSRPMEAYHSSSDPDTMTIQEALKQDDRAEFIKAMYKEIQDHIDRKHWMVVPRSSVPNNRKLIPMVWSMKRKRDPAGSIIKWKARLCVGGHRQIHGIDYWSTYAPVVSWSTIRLIITIAVILDWHIHSID
ncbi:MAG: reverse transcriptase domain-containing protein, partial [Bacteroidota bacterium]